MSAETNAKKIAQIKASGYAAQKKWAKKTMKSVQVLLHREYEADVIAFWEGLDNKRQWFIDTCRRAMIDE